MRYTGWLSLILLIVLAGSDLAFISINQGSQDKVFFNPASVQVTVGEPLTYYGISVADGRIIEGKVKRNQPLIEILKSYNAPDKFLRQLSTIDKKVFNTGRIIPGRKYTIISNPDSTARAFIYEPDPTQYVVLNFSDTLYVDVCRREVVSVERHISGTIQSSLSETIYELGKNDALTNSIVDVFAWVIDFQHLYPGDRFKVVYSEKQVDGKTIGIEKIITASFEHQGRTFNAFSYDQGSGIDYFDEEGKSLRKAFLRYPIEFTRISSRYSLNRFHPVQKRYKAHLGTDFAAPTGTPIKSVGDGIVLEARYTSANGNYVKIRHNGTYTTQYLHMSRIAPGIKPGTHVRQGQWIGNVGSTGLATGPHLCFRFWKNGVQVDALRVDLPEATPIRSENMEEFGQVAATQRLLLDAVKFPEQEILMADAGSSE